MTTKNSYVNVWQKNNRDQVRLTVPKGKKEVIRAHAASVGESVQGFINRAIDETMQRDADRISQQGTEPDA